MDIGIGNVIVVLVHGVEVNDLHQDTQRTVQSLGTSQRILHGDTDDDISPHGTSQVNGEVIRQATVHQHHLPNTHWREDGRDSHRGAQGLRQTAGVEVHLRIVHEIRSHTGKGNGQFVEVDGVGITRTEFLEQHIDVLALDETTIVVVALADSQSSGEDIGVLFLPVAQTLMTHVLTVTDHIAPVQSPHQGVECIGIVSDGIETTHQTTHRGSRHNVYRQSGTLNDLQRTDMRRTLRTAAAQHDGHLLARKTRHDCHHGQQQTDNLLHISTAKITKNG